MSQWESPVKNFEGVKWFTIEPTIVEPTTKHRFTIILCHGRGSNGQTFRDEIFESTSSKECNLCDHFPSVKWVFPSAGLPFDPRVPVEDEAQWFSISSLVDPDRDQSRQYYGMAKSIKYIHRIINHEIEVIGGKSSHVSLGGISQGCGAAIHTLLSGQHRLNSFVGFCSWLPFRELALHDENRYLGIDSGLQQFYRWHFEIDNRAYRDDPIIPTHTPCFLSHNADDDVVDVKQGRLLCEALRNIGMNVTWDEHEHGNPELTHWIQEPEGIDNLVAFLEASIGVLKEDDK